VFIEIERGAKYLKIVVPTDVCLVFIEIEMGAKCLKIVPTDVSLVFK
jgi:hypothetical protein